MHEFKAASDSAVTLEQTNKMNEPSETLDVLNDRWDIVCMQLFGEKIGRLVDFAPWLVKNIEQIGKRKSTVSGKEVVSAPTAYCENSGWIGLDEIDFSKEFEPLDINEIKDIDSIVEALSERVYYSGNIFFGNSSNIEKSSNVNDSFYIYNCARFGNSKYLAYSTVGRQNTDCFGCNAVSESISCIKCSGVHRDKRCFEVWMSQNTSDSYYSYGLNGCTNCVFCFNVKKKKNAIGNLELEPQKYKQIKDKLISDIAESLKKERQVRSLVEIAADSKTIPSHCFDAKDDKSAQDKSKIETAFSQTTAILFGKGLSNIDQYASWLTKHTRVIERGTSVGSGKELFIPKYANYQTIPKNRLLTASEAKEFGERWRLDANEIDDLTLKNAHEKIGKIAFFNAEISEGRDVDNHGCAVIVDSFNCYRSSVVEYSKYCGYSFWPRSCQYLFGCDSPFDTAFGIHCYSCLQLTRCFEVDCSGYCSDSYFCHNCENVHSSMFCFNVKNKNCAIGNAILEQQKFKSVRVALLEQIVNELESKKDLRWDIYNIGKQR